MIRARFVPLKKLSARESQPTIWPRFALIFSTVKCSEHAQVDVTAYLLFKNDLSNGTIIEVTLQ